MTLRFWRKRNSAPCRQPQTVWDMLPGSQARITGFENLPTQQADRLQAYGLAIGQSVRVLQHRPVTVVRVACTELAFEAEMARSVRVEAELLG